MLIEIAAEIPARARGVVYTAGDRTLFALSWSLTTLLTASNVGNYVRDTWIIDVASVAINAIASMEA
jgi:hypothetical protein